MRQAYLENDGLQPTISATPYGWKALGDAVYPHFKATSATVALSKDQTYAVVKTQADKKPADAMKAVNEALVTSKGAALTDISSIAAPVVAADGTSSVATYLVELFPSNIRYTSMSLPYHMGNGWVGRRCHSWPRLKRRIMAAFISAFGIR